MNAARKARTVAAIMRPWPWFGATLLASLTASATPDPPKHVRLRYELAGAEGCPDRAELEGAVEAELGYPPFSDTAEELLFVKISERSGTLEALVQLKDRSGAVQGERNLSSAAGNCGELARTLALAVAIAIDPVRANQPKPPKAAAEPAPKPEPPPPAPEPAPKIETPAPAPAPEKPSEPFRARVAGGARLAFGIAPAPAPGIWIAGGLGKRAYSLDVEGRATFAVEHEVPDGKVSASTLTASLLPCLQFGVLHTCASATLGALQGSGQDVDRPRKATTVYAAAGARAGLEVPRGSALVFVADLDLDANLTRTTLRINDREAWSSPPVAFGSALGLRGRF